MFIGTFFLPFELPNYEDISSWNDYDLTSMEIDEELQMFSHSFFDKIESDPSSIRIEFDGEHYVGGGTTIFSYNFYLNN